MASKTNLKRLVKDGKASITEVIKDSARTQAKYAIQDPSERLIATLGATMLNEPKYYPTDAGSTMGYTYDASDFDEQAQLIINTAMEIAQSDSPQDLLAIAHWARKELKMRTTPQVLLAVAAHCNETKKFVRSYSPKIIQRADELKQAFIAYRSLFGTKGSLPNSLKRGLADTFQKFDEADYLKWEGSDRPTFADVLKMVDRRKNYPLPAALDTYLKTGEVIDEAAIPMIAARKKLAKLKTFGPQAKALAQESRAGWEVLVSQFGNNKEVWEHLLDTEQLGYQAMMMNLRNLLEAGVSKKHIDGICSKLVSGAAKSRQLPHKFMTAHKIVAGLAAPHKELVVGALENALYELVKGMAQLPGRSLIAVDTSGSMSSPVAGKSQVTCKEAASVLGALAKTISGKGSVIGAFADTFKPVSGTSGLNPLKVSARVQETDAGGGTNAAAVMQFAHDAGGEKFDRLILLSDMQTYGQANYSFGHSKRSRTDFKGLVEQYREEKNKDFYVHSFDLAGYGNSLTDQGDTKTNLIAGFSEKLLDTILRFEGVITDEGEEKQEKKQEFTLEYIRKNF